MPRASETAREPLEPPSEALACVSTCSRQTDVPKLAAQTNTAWATQRKSWTLEDPAASAESTP
eukprot:1060226-Alexandrium_andersonii.AAC.1